MYLKGNGWEDVEWINLAQEKLYCRDVVIAVGSSWLGGKLTGFHEGFWSVDIRRS